MKDLNYGKDYKYAHDFQDGQVDQEHFPEEVKTRKFYHPTDRGFETTVQDRMDHFKGMMQMPTHSLL